MNKIYKLSNGLSAVIEDIKYVSSVSIGVWIKTGSRNEDTFNNGISHFIEHMLFKGTKKRTSKEIIETIEDYGGEINAFTGKEATCFYAKVLYSHIERTLELFNDIIFNSLLLEEEIEKEKKVIIEEINMSEDSPEEVLGDLHSKIIYGDNGLGLPILGNMNTVNNFTRNDLVKYLNEYYIPENMVISISGKINVDETLKLLEKFFGNFNRISEKKVTNFITPKTHNGFIYKDKPIEQAHISLGLRGYPIGDDKIYSTHIISTIFGGSASSILFQKLREDMGVCYSVYSYNSAYNNTGVYNIYAGVNPNKLHDAINAIKSEARKFKEYEITKELLNKTKEQIKGNYVLSLESTSNRMFANGKNALFFNKIKTSDEILALIDRITIEETYEALKHIFSPGIINGAIVGPNIDENHLKLLEL